MARNGSPLRILPAALLALLAALVFGACGAGTGSTPTPPKGSGPATSTPAASGQPTGTPTPTATPTQTCAPIVSGAGEGGPGPWARITDVRVGTADGRDRLVIQFDSAVTPYEIATNPDGVLFHSSAKGEPIRVSGSAGVVVHVYHLNLPDQYPAGTDLTPGYTVLSEVRLLGEYEGQADFGIGLTSAVCPVVTVLSGPPRLVIDFHTP